MPDLVLYNYWRSSSSHRVRIALELKGLAYRYVAVNLLTDENWSEAHRARSPTGYVPCLVVDGAPFVESVAILELLDDLVLTPRLYPEDARERAHVRELVEIVNSGMQPLQNRSVTNFLSKEAEVQRAWLHHFLGRGLAALETAMERNEGRGVRGPYAYGQTPTAADALLVPQVVSAQRFKLDLSPHRRVVRAFEAASALEAVQRAAPERQPDAAAK